MKYIITSGPMEMNIDSVRKIKNSSTGKLGSIFVEQLLARKIEPVYIHTPGAIIPAGNFKQIEITTHQQLLQALTQELTDDSVVIHAMAISDFELGGTLTYDQLFRLITDNPITSREQLQALVTSELVISDKLSSKDDQIVILNRAVKVVDQIKKINPEARIVGFKLLSNVSHAQLVSVANDIRKRANCEFVVANLKEQVSAESHIATIVGDGLQYQVKTKQQIANKIIELMEE